MIKQENNSQATDEAMVLVLEQLLADDSDITARAVARLHPTLAAASSITRNPMRMALLLKYKEQLAERRRWRSRVSHMSGVQQSISLAEKDARIAELEATIQLLIGSHVALLRAVGELGGFSKWAKFYPNYSAARDKLSSLGALPASMVHPFPSTSTDEV